MTESFLAIVLRTVRYEDRHLVVTALTQEKGLITAIARNAIHSRRFGGALDLFTGANWICTEKPGATMYCLSEASVRRAYEGVRRDLAKLAAAGVFSELLAKITTERQPCPDLFRLHTNALAALEEAPLGDSAAVLAIINGYLAKLLQWFGARPRLGVCLGCSLALDSVPENSRLSCDVAAAGWRCNACSTCSEGALSLDPVALVDFFAALSLPIRKLPAASRSDIKTRTELLEFLKALLIYHVPGFDRSPLKALRFIFRETHDPVSIAPPPQDRLQ